MPGASRLACLFHLNLAFSSLEAEARAAVIERCYWPILRLPEQTGFPVAVELTGWTLEQIATLDPEWLAEARRLLEAGSLELVGSGHAQCAGPLLPADVNAWNLRLGLEDYERLLGVRPRIALVNEQAYAPGLVELYAEAGFEAIIADWENAHRSHPEWPSARRRLPQRAQRHRRRGAAGAVQRVARVPALPALRPRRAWRSPTGSTGPTSAARPGPAGLLLYANDAEVFDHRPGRFAAEPAPRRRRVGADRRGPGRAGRPCARRSGRGPTRAAVRVPRAARGRRPERVDAGVAGPSRPGQEAEQVQRRRWAVERPRRHRHQHGVCAAGDRVAPAMMIPPRGARWWSCGRPTCAPTSPRRAGSVALDAFADAAERWDVRVPAPRPPAPAVAALPSGVTSERSTFTAVAGPLTVVLDGRPRALDQGLSRRARLRSRPVRHLPHGYYETIDLGADWYSGTVVQERPGHHKVTDLSPATVTWAALDGGALRAWAAVQTPLGPIEKVLTLHPDDGLELDVTLRWSALPEGSLRAGTITLNPEAFDGGTLAYATHNGGRDLERHRLAGEPFDHGRAVSTLVSATQGVGITEGFIAIGDAHRHLAVSVEREVATPLGLISYRPVPGSFFARLS